MTDSKKTPVELAQELEKSLSRFVSSGWGDCVYVVVAATGAEQYTPRPGFNQDDEYVWEKVLTVHRNLIPCCNQEINNLWKEIYAFLYETIGKSVEAEAAKKQDKQKMVNQLMLDYNFLVRWGMEIPDDFNAKYPEEMKTLYYNSNSGWGHHNMLNVENDATYLQVWNAVDLLVKRSGDSHHIFLENFFQMKEPGSFSVSLGS